MRDYVTRKQPCAVWARAYILYPRDCYIIDFVTQSISPRQFGFLRKRSTLQQLLIFLNTLYNSFTDNTSTDVIYLDFKKAFDSVAHNELLVKLWEFGITGNLWKWFRAYLGHRRQWLHFEYSARYFWCPTRQYSWAYFIPCICE